MEAYRKFEAITSRNVRKTFIIVLATGFWGLSALEYRVKDQATHFITDQAQREDDFYLTLEGQQELAIAREMSKELHERRMETEREREKTKEGREEVERERVERSLSLRFKATNLQLELLKLDREINKHEGVLRMQLLDKARRARNEAIKAGVEEATGSGQGQGQVG